MARLALTSAELSLLRTRPQSARYYLAVHRPPVIFQAVLSGVPNNFPGSQVAYAGVTSGAITQVSAGMTLLVGTIAGASNLGVIRIRSSANNVLNLAEFGSGLVNWQANASLTAIEEFAPWPIHSAYQTSTSRWLVDFDLFANQLVQYGPMALLGPPMVGFMDGATMAASYVGDRSYSLTPGASIISQRWEFPDGIKVTSGLGSSLTPIHRVYTNTSPGGRYHSLTVTDGNGASHIGRRLTFSFGSANQPHPVSFEAITGGVRQGGYQTRIVVHSSAGSQNFPDGAQVVIFDVASYGTAGSSVGGNYPFRNNVVLAGYIDNDTTRFDPWTGEVSFSINTINKVLSKTDAYDLFLQGASGGGTAASDWDMAASLSLDRAAIALTKYRSTIANITDVNFASGLFMNEGNGLQFQSLPRASLWNQLTQNYGDKGMLGLVAADLQSSIYCMSDAQVDGGSANLPITLNVTKQDRRDAVTFERDNKDIVSEQSLYAVNGVSPIGAISPGAPTGYFGGRKEVTRGLAACSQDILITWTGNVRARENNTYKRIVVPLAGNMRIDSVPQSRVQMSLSATENVRGIAFNNENLLINETNIRYDSKNGAALTEIVLEKSVNGIGGSAITFPATGGSNIGPFPIIRMPPLRVIPSPPLPVPIPVTGEHGANMLGIGDDDTIIATTNFLDSSPTWTNITGAVTGTLLVLRLDPWDPANKAVCVSSTGVWVTSDIRSTVPTWTNTLTLAQMRVLTGYSTDVFYDAMMTSPTVNGFIGLVAYHTVSGSTVRMSYVRTNNYSGGAGTFMSTEAGDQIWVGGSSHGFWVSQHDINRVYISFGHVSDNMGILYSLNGGLSWSNKNTGIVSSAWSHGGALFIPYQNNSDDNLIFIMGDPAGGSGQASFGKTTTGVAGTWTSLSSQMISDIGVCVGSPYIDGITESPSVIGGTGIIFMGRRQTAISDTYVVSYNGSNFTLLASVSSIAYYDGYGLGGWPANNTQLQVNNAGFGAGGVGRSLDGGVTWINRTGNLATIGVTTNVKFLVPIWSMP